MGRFKNILKGYQGPLFEKLKEIQEFLKENLSDHRYEHSLLTLEKSIELSEKFSDLNDNEKGQLYLAALSHDITKEMPAHFHHEILSKNNLKDLSELPTTLFHSHSAPFFLKERFSINDEVILHAVRYHSTGCGQMPLLSRIVFAADFLSSSYAQKKGLEEKESLDGICLIKLLTSIEFILSKKMPVQCDSINFYNILVRNRKNEESRS